MSGWLSAAKLPPAPALRLSAYQPAFCDNGIQMYTLEVLLLFPLIALRKRRRELPHQIPQTKNQGQTMAVKINSGADGSLSMKCALLMTECRNNSLHLSAIQKDFNRRTAVKLSAAHKS